MWLHDNRTCRRHGSRLSMTKGWDQEEGGRGAATRTPSPASPLAISGRRRALPACGTRAQAPMRRSRARTHAPGMCAHARARAARRADAPHRPGPCAAGARACAHMCRRRGVHPRAPAAHGPGRCGASARRAARARACAPARACKCRGRLVCGCWA